MSKQQHTPGPWIVLPEEMNRVYIRVRGTVLGGRYKIANVLSPNYEGEYEFEKDESRANAYLIAASPELLKVLEQLVERCDDSDGACYGTLSTTFVREMAAPVIARARGES